jgi:ABC transporter substrate binding protein
VFTQALAALGWNEGTKIDIEYRWAAGDTARVRAYAAELARLAPDAFVQGTPAATALQQAAPTTPLVFVNVADPVITSLVSSLARPGGNVTGSTNGYTLEHSTGKPSVLPGRVPDRRSHPGNCFGSIPPSTERARKPQQARHLPFQTLGGRRRLRTGRAQAIPPPMVALMRPACGASWSIATLRICPTS